MTTPDTTLNQVLPDLASFDPAVNVRSFQQLLLARTGTSMPLFEIDVPSTPSRARTGELSC